MNKPEAILQLEKELNTTFTQVPEIISDGWNKSAEYAIDNTGNIIGLRIERFDLKELPNPLKKKQNFQQLTHLNLFYNQLSDISPLGKLKNFSNSTFKLPNII